MLILAILMAQVDPYAVFAASDSILSGIDDFTYSFRYSGTGDAENIIPVLSGRTSLSRSASVPHPLMVHDFLSTERDTGIHPVHVPASYIATEDSLYRFDFNKNRVYSVSAEEPSSGVFDFPSASLMMELVIDDPFSDELAADSIQILPADTIMGEPCHVFRVHYAVYGVEAVWYISSLDMLPRAVERLGEQGGEFLQIWDLSRGRPFIGPGEEAPEVFLADTEGFVRRIRFPRDEPLVVLFFSPGGENSLNALGTAAEFHENGIEVVGIAISRGEDTGFRLSSLDIPFPVLVYGGKAAEDYGVDYLPSAVLVDPQGRVVISAEGLESIESGEFPDMVLGM